MKVQTIYDQVTEVLLESGGFTLGIVTEDDFLRMFGEVVQDFIQQSSIVKKLVNVLVSTPTSIYDKPNVVDDIEEMFYDERYLHQTEAIDFDYWKRNWKAESGRPRRWHTDRVPVDQFEVQPDPSQDGYSVTAAAPFYGTLSEVSAAVDFDITSSAAFYGVIASFSGPVYLEAISWVFGTISDMVSSSKNVTLVGTARPPSITFALDDVIEVIPDSFTQYLKWGVLGRIFSLDSEMRDVQRSLYCTARFKEGVELARLVSQEALEDEPAMLAG